MNRVVVENIIAANTDGRYPVLYCAPHRIYL